MNPLFADTFYFLALFSGRDSAHARAREFSNSQTSGLVTTAWILTEVANTVARSSKRGVVRSLLEDLERDAMSQIVPASQDPFQRGISLYDARPDKNWSLTDCISFVVMQDHGITEALTADHPFEQAGFVALLKD